MNEHTRHQESFTESNNLDSVDEGGSFHEPEQQLEQVVSGNTHEHHERAIAGSIDHEGEGDVTDPSHSPEKKAAQLSPEQEAANKAYEEYWKRFEHVINGYFGTPDVPFTMEPGGWYVDLEHIRVNADPTFFMQKGYSESESLFATFHEAEHFRDMIRDPKAYKNLFQRIERQNTIHKYYPKSLSRLYNCLDDVLVNKSVMSRWKAGVRAKDSLYPKLFPSQILNTHPRSAKPLPKHRQFMYALLRSSMLPDEALVLDPDVAEKITEVNFRGEGNPELVQLLTATSPMGESVFLPEDRFALIAAKIEPAFLELFQKDITALEEEKKKGDAQESDPQKGDPSDEEGDGDPFGGDPFEDGIPDPIDFNEIQNKVNSIRDKLAKAQQDRFAKTMGVEKRDFDAYVSDFKRIESYIEELSTIFDEVIERRKTYHRRLRKATKDGPMLDPRKAATAVAEVRAGNLEPVVMLDYERVERVDNVPSQFEFTLVCDGSGSMQGGSKEVMQRRLAVLIMEAFADFRSRIAKANRAGDDIRLNIKTEVRMFSDKDVEVKPMSDEMTHQERVAMHKSLRALPGGGNNELTTFEVLKESLHKDTVQRLEDGELKKIILFLSDGETDTAAIQQEITAMQTVGGENLVIAGIGFEGGQQAIQTYAPHGYYAQNIADVPNVFREFLKEMLNTI